jgi:signal transduction histidine kinase
MRSATPIERHPVRPERECFVHKLAPGTLTVTTPGTCVSAELTELNDEQFRANRFELVSRLADDLAHEIKNPLNAIVINLEVLRARIRKNATEAALDRTDVIEGEVRRLHQLIDRMLQLLRPDREQTEGTALDRALDEILPLIEAQTRLARNMFVAECQSAVFVPVRRDVLKFALLNVFTAIHERLGEGGGTLFLECEPSDREVRLTIRDVHGVPHSSINRDGVGEAARIAGALLESCRGRVSHDGAGVTVVLPRSGPF